jgi:hypothetical protein
MNLQENIQRIKEMMGINEESFLEYLGKQRIEKDREKFPHREKKYSEESNLDFSNSKVKDIVWRAGGMDLDPRSGGLWFAENKEDTEKFAISVRNEKRVGKPYLINLENPMYYDSFWHGYINDVGYDQHGREQLMYNLIDLGHDGIIIDTDTWNDTGDENSVRSKQYVVFNPENVKPA